MAGLVAVGYFLFVLFFSLLTMLLWIRIALRYVRMSPLHPMSQHIYRLSNPLIIPLTRLMPATTARSRYDWPCFCLLVLVELLKFMAIGALFLGAHFPLRYLPLYTLADLIVQPCNLLFYAILIRVIMSWVNPHWHHPVAELIYRVTEPCLSPLRRHIPVFAGIDFSPFIAMIGLKVITLFISASLPIALI